MSYQYDIAPIVDVDRDRSSVQNYLGTSKYFDEHILSHEDLAMKIWRGIMRRYANKEQEYVIPYNLAESMKLYAVDALAVATPLVKEHDEVFKMAEFFVVFYLIVHYFDDHVEHRDKFYSKFDFNVEKNIDTQRGAAPFSFVFISFDILYEIISEVTHISIEDRERIMHRMSGELARQTRYFASERQSNLDIEETLEMKQRQVAGKALAFFGELIGAYLGYDAKQLADLCHGLMYLGSLTQITDDIRDQSVDMMLRNANIVIIAHKLLGVKAGNEKLNAIFDNEVALATRHLSHFYDDKQVSELCSLPFYPFMVDKQELAKE